MEDAKAAMDVERTRLQAQVRDMEREALQLQQQLRFTQDELQKCHENNAQAQNEEKELQARLANEIEERERIQLQLHQVKKQVKKRANPIIRFQSILWLHYDTYCQHTFLVSKIFTLKMLKIEIKFYNSLCIISRKIYSHYLSIIFVDLDEKILNRK